MIAGAAQFVLATVRLRDEVAIQRRRHQERIARSGVEYQRRKEPPMKRALGSTIRNPRLLGDQNLD
jgi:hypothetical protein